MRLSRTDVRSFACPACAASAGEACQGARKLRNGRAWERVACHQERWELAEENAEVLTFNSEGILANSRGDEVGRVIELTLDLSAARLTGGGGHGQAVSLDPLQSGAGTQRTENPAVVRVWAHYQRTIAGAERQTLEGKRRRIIVNALKVRSEAECIPAIDGLARSPFHNGQNDRRKKYLGIQYALKGVGAEGDDERIDKMAALAGTTSVEATVPSAQREMVRERQRHVVEWLKNPGDDRMRATGERAAAWLKETLGLIYVRDVRATGGGFWEREANE